MTAAADFLNAFRGYIGKVEEPPGSNRVPGVTDRYGMVGPWCAMSITCALEDAGYAGFHYAYCPYIEHDARAGVNGLRWSDTPEVGALALYDWEGDGIADHVEAVEALEGAFMVTIGGNVADACKRQRRRIDLARGFVILPWAAPLEVTVGPGGSPPAPAPAMPTVRQGSRGQAVADLQRVLNAKAGAGLAVDGVFGPATFEAVENVQRFFALSVDGIVGPQTWTMVLYLAAYAPDAHAVAANRPQLAQGADGDDVVALQRRLLELGYDLGPARDDGQFGRATAAAVRGFQASHGLVADGIVGPLTWAALG